MKEIMKKLEGYGVNIAEVMERFVGDEDLYIECLNSFINDPAFISLKDALAKKDYSAAFDSAHTLKGVTGNLGLTPLYRSVVNLVEPLRIKEISNVPSLYKSVVDEHERLKKLLNK